MNQGPASLPHAPQSTFMPQLSRTTVLHLPPHACAGGSSTQPPLLLPLPPPLLLLPLPASPPHGPQSTFMPQLSRTTVLHLPPHACAGGSSTQPPLLLPLPPPLLLLPLPASPPHGPQSTFMPQLSRTTVLHLPPHACAGGSSTQPPLLLPLTPLLLPLPPPLLPLTPLLLPLPAPLLLPLPAPLLLPPIPPSFAGTLASAPLPPPHEATHAPFKHPDPVEHAFPHAPQFWESFWRSVQLLVPPEGAELHTIDPVGHCVAHVPPEHTSLPGQIEAHVPLLHVWPCEHFVPHWPQLVGSFWRSAHWLPHAVYVPPPNWLQKEQSTPPSWSGDAPHPLFAWRKHAVAHWPFTHASFAPHLLPHEPQFCESSCVFVHMLVPPLCAALQTCVPLGHDATHAPPPHTSLPVQIDTQLPLLQTSPAPHAVPHAPQ